MHPSNSKLVKKKLNNYAVSEKSKYGNFVRNTGPFSETCRLSPNLSFRWAVLILHLRSQHLLGTFIQDEISRIVCIFENHEYSKKKLLQRVLRKHTSIQLNVIMDVSLNFTSVLVLYIMWHESDLKTTKKIIKHIFLCQKSFSCQCYLFDDFFCVAYLGT